MKNAPFHFEMVPSKLKAKSHEDPRLSVTASL
jgi:hypothetical protein